jgi:NAD(P)-dependent dehydrogenase (short-subunit alcohol dehydrogenase family)
MVVVTDLDDSRGQAVVAEINGAGGEAIFLGQDVSLQESWPGVIDATERRFGRLNVMVANAGIGIMCKAVEMLLADWRRQTAVNRRCVPVGEVRRSSDAASRRWLHHHYIIRCRPPGIGRISRLLRHKGRRPPVRGEGGRDRVRGRIRRDTGQHSSSRRHRHADLDEAIRVCWPQRADRRERGRQSGVPLRRVDRLRTSRMACYSSPPTLLTT